MNTKTAEIKIAFVGIYIPFSTFTENALYIANVPINPMIVPITHALVP